MHQILFNPFSNNNHGTEVKDNALNSLGLNDCKVHDVTKIDTDSLLTNLNHDDEIIIIGGDGTLNHFANDYIKNPVPNPCYLYAGGTGNDFLKDLDSKDILTPINQYLNHLPVLEIGDNPHHFLNNVGLGLDGMVCVTADKLKSQGKAINYTKIAIQLFLYQYTPRNARVIVDGHEYHHQKVWLAASMNGRYYGGGMKMAPNQDRQSDKLTLVIIHSIGRLKTLMRFPKIFSGRHIQCDDMTSVYEGYDIEVYFDTPCALQYDGEVIDNVSHYKVHKASSTIEA